MRLNIYSQEITDEFKIVEKTGPGGETFSAVMFMLNSSPLLHQPPEHVGDEDDRSAVAFWIPKSEHRRESFAQMLESMAITIRNAKAEDMFLIEAKARELVLAKWEKESVAGITDSTLSRDNYIEKRWYYFVDEAKELLSKEGAAAPGQERIFVESHTHKLWHDMRNAIDGQNVRTALAAIEKQVNVSAGDEDNNADFTCGQLAILDQIKDVVSPDVNLPSVGGVSIDQLSLSETEAKDPRVDLLLLFLRNIYSDPKTSWTKEELSVFFGNALYLTMTGTHEERIRKINELRVSQSE